MSRSTYPMRLSAADLEAFREAAQRESVSMAEFLRRAGRSRAREQARPPASVQLSREGFTLPEWPGKTERERIRNAIRQRHARHVHR